MSRTRALKSRARAAYFHRQRADARTKPASRRSRRRYLRPPRCHCQRHLCSVAPGPARRQVRRHARAKRHRDLANRRLRRASVCFQNSRRGGVDSLNRPSVTHALNISAGAPASCGRARASCRIRFATTRPARRSLSKANPNSNSDDISRANPMCNNSLAKPESRIRRANANARAGAWALTKCA